MTTYESSTFSHAAWSSASMSDAEYRAMGSAFEATMVGVGLTQVSTTANWASDTVPGASATTWGNQTIYKFDDGITPELYVKCEYGRGAAANAAAQYMLGFSISPDNSNWTTRIYVCFGSTAADTSQQWAGSFTEHGLVIVCDSATETASYSRPTLVVERSRNWSDVANNTGALIKATGPAVGSTTVGASAAFTGYRMKASSFASTAWGNYRVEGAGAPGTANTVTNNLLPVYPLIVSLDEFSWPCRTVCYVNNSVVGALSQMTVNAAGTNRTYRTTRSTGTGIAPSGYRWAYRWE